MILQTSAPLPTSLPVPTALYPVLFAPAGTPPTGHHAAPSGRPGERLLGKRVLIVEDEAMVALELQYAFEDEGAEIVGPAQTLARALATVSQDHEIDVALLDVDLAGENIYPVADLLRQRGVPFAFHTGHGSRSEIGALFPGATTFMKPALPEALIEHLAGIAR
ncbi:MAG: response regulator [Novosphingobium sp.]|nr:MAG: response regulator [Novosphingobium sp.]